MLLFLILLLYTVSAEIDVLTFRATTTTTKLPESTITISQVPKSTTSSTTSTSTTTTTSTTQSTSRNTRTTRDFTDPYNPYKGLVKRYGLDLQFPKCFPGRKTEWSSPINVDIERARPVYLDPLVFHNYETDGQVRARFDFFTEHITGFSTWRRQPFISGGGLNGDYFLSEIQLHSEMNMRQLMDVGHSINGARYTIELHLVHTRKGVQLSSFVEGDVVIMAIFVEIAHRSPIALTEDKIYSTLNTKLGASNKDLDASNTSAPYLFVKPKVLLPTDTSTFFKYNGSLPTPPCNNGVQWILLTKPVWITYDQLQYIAVSSVSSFFPLPVLTGYKPKLGDRELLLCLPSNSSHVVLDTLSVYKYLLLFSLFIFSALSFVALFFLFTTRKRAAREPIVSFDNKNFSISSF